MLDLSFAMESFSANVSAGFKSPGVLAAFAAAQYISFLATFVLGAMVLYLAAKLKIVDDYKNKITSAIPIGPKKPSFLPVADTSVIGALLAERDARSLILKADDALARALSTRGLPGRGLSEMLNYVTPAEVRNLFEVLQAHGAAEALRENPAFLVPQAEAERLFGIYKAALTDLGVK